MTRLAKSAFDCKHVRSVMAYVLTHPDCERPGAIAGRIVGDFSDNPNGAVCTATLHVWAGPLKFIPTTTGKAGGGGYDKASAAVCDALYRAREDAKMYPGIDDNDKMAALEFPDLAGRGMSTVAEWFRKHGYECEGVIGC